MGIGVPVRRCLARGMAAMGEMPARAMFRVQTGCGRVAVVVSDRCMAGFARRLRSAHGRTGASGCLGDERQNGHAEDG